MEDMFEHGLTGVFTSHPKSKHERKPRQRLPGFSEIDLDRMRLRRRWSVDDLVSDEHHGFRPGTTSLARIEISDFRIDFPGFLHQDPEQGDGGMAVGVTMDSLRLVHRDGGEDPDCQCFPIAGQRSNTKQFQGNR